MTRTEEIRLEMKKLQEELTSLGDVEMEARKAKKKATPRRWRFTLTPEPSKRRLSGFDACLDPTLTFWRIKGVVLNREECEAAGWDKDSLMDGSILYLFNPLSGYLVAYTGGGRIFISSDNEGDSQRVSGDIGRFINEHPDGGDITEILYSQKSAHWR